MSEYVYSMYKVNKFYGAERHILQNITLSFLKGAKIGVLGPNGAGKSTILRIMAGLEETVLYGDPAKPGLYIIRVRFQPGAMSSPHFHPDERQITVIKGPWWAGTGPKWDRDATIALPTGSFAVHRANEIHYDGAKDQEVIVQISGIGPTGTTKVDETGKPK